MNEEQVVYKPSALAMFLVSGFMKKYHGQALSIVLHRKELERLVDTAIELAEWKLTEKIPGKWTNNEETYENTILSEWVQPEEE